MAWTPDGWFPPQFALFPQPANIWFNNYRCTYLLYGRPHSFISYRATWPQKCQNSFLKGFQTPVWVFDLKTSQHYDKLLLASTRIDDWGPKEMKFRDIVLPILHLEIQDESLLGLKTVYILYLCWEPPVTECQFPLFLSRPLLSFQLSLSLSLSLTHTHTHKNEDSLNNNRWRENMKGNQRNQLP